MAKPEPTLMDKIVSLCKRRGFVFPASEIYGGIGNTYDYGPLGVELIRRVKEAWWGATVTEREDVVGLDSAIIQNPQTWITSGHVGGFTDPMVDCKKCKGRFRADKLEDARCPEKPSKRPGECDGELTEPREFNLMFKTTIGPVEETGSTAYLRPETAQGIFLNFKNVLESARAKPPFGIAQIGKSFRNEITPGNFVFRTREFEQAEMEFFVPPAEEQQWFDFWVKERFDWYVRHGIDPAKLRLRVHEDKELAHYSTATSDIEYEYPFGWGELEGIACRTDFDLKRHSEASGTDLLFFDPQTKEHYTPFVIEPAGGINRMALTFLIDAYEEQQLEKDTRVVLHLHPSIAPITVAVLPLVKKEGMPEKAREIGAMLRRARYSTSYDEKAAIGRRYRRQDEAGTPFCVTIDGETLTENTVTLRHRDSMEQERVPVAELRGRIDAAIEAWKRPGA
ncbi:glycine--tRNA ligase [Engelhardtia mirabilis]|uniref:Glycine--tRNA ligase n=1 Tax=Engelhardtia mirabilis TaxID=2528011 RepID=A0A518BMW8_9BACT|nr:Glycine--tRNA ligase [Planctomycetes bacterium Pla133]QDV02612.1 Glycine--tRNA ligase [Planctomycetes bacterium Pla86]